MAKVISIAIDFSSFKEVLEAFQDYTFYKHELKELLKTDFLA